MTIFILLFGFSFLGVILLPGFPFSARVALPPPPKFYPNHLLLQFIPYAFQDGKVAGFHAQSNHTTLYNPMVLRFSKAFLRTFDLDPAGPQGITEALRRNQAETITVLAGFDLPDGSPVEPY